MPKVGDVALLPHGKAGKRRSHIWVRCPSCGAERWSVLEKRDQRSDRLCHRCINLSPEVPFLCNWDGSKGIPPIGTVARLNGKNASGHYLFVWCVCPECGIQRWVPRSKVQSLERLCKSCAAQINVAKAHRSGEQHWNWKGGRFVRDGYVYVKLQPDDFFYPMADKAGYVAEHRLVVAKGSKRCLLPWETVHHKDEGVKDDNRLEKLKLHSSRSQHGPDTVIKSRMRQLEKQVEKQQRLLIWLCQLVGSLQQKLQYGVEVSVENLL